MKTTIKSVPLARQLVGHYLVFGLGCLLLCFTAMLYLAFRGNTSDLAPMIALSASALLAIGAYVIFNTVKRGSEILEQLHGLASAGSAEHAGIRPVSLPGRDPATLGWNRLIERVAESDTWTRLQEQLAKTMESQQQQGFHSLFEKLPQAIALTDNDGNLCLSTRALQGLLSSNDEEANATLDGKSILTLIEAIEPTNLEELASALNESRGSLSVDLRRGTSIDAGVIRVSRRAFSHESQEKIAFLWTLQDVTQQLLTADSQSHFVLTATHELRTPLANIKAYAEVLEIEEGVDVEKQKEFCNIINSEATRLARFVDELLNISQMEAGALSIQKHNTDLEMLVQETIEHVQPEFDRKKIAFEAKCPAKWPRLELDKDKFASALVNLLGNAAKYTPEGGRCSLEIEVEEDQIHFHVDDTGFGISEEELARVFDTFFRSDDERVREEAGNGLGLAFTQEVVRLHGGRLEVQSELNKGSRFTMSLPLA